MLHFIFLHNICCTVRNHNFTEVFEMIIHVTQKGDSLYSIGRQHGVTIEQLLAANGPTVQPTLIVGQAVIVPAPAEKLGNVLANGYAYPNIDQIALFSSLPYLSMITPFSYGIRTDGSLVELDDSELITIAENNNVAPVLLITTLTDEGRFSSENAAAVLSSPEATQALADNIIQKLQMRNYFGVDIDFEYIPPEYRDEYTAFIELLHSMAQPLGYKVIVALAPKTSSIQRGLLYEAHDYAALGAAADYVLVMTYEWGYTYGPPMAIAPLNKVEEVINYAVSQIPPEKLLMGVPNYAYDWTLPFVKGSAAKSMSNNRAIELAREVGAEIMYDDIAQTPYYHYYDQNKKQHVVWFEDARSIAAKMQLLSNFELAGYSIWNIMSFYKPMMTVMESMFNIKKL